MTNSFIRSFCGGEDCTEVGTELGLVYLEPNMSELRYVRLAYYDPSPNDGSFATIMSMYLTINDACLRPYLSESVWEKLNSGDRKKVSIVP